MKIKHLLIGLFAVAATVACDQEEPVETPSLEVSQETLALDAKEDEASFDVTSNLAWTATADETWVHLDPSSADASKDPVTVTVTADDNTAEEARTAVITVKAGELTKTIELTQAAAEAEDPGDEPGDELEITELYLLGDACDTGWSIDAMTQFTFAEGVYVWEGNLKPEGAFRFPLQKVSGKFWPCLVPNADGTAVTYAEDEVENTFRVETDGLYKITVNPETLAMTVERLGDRPESELILYILGGAINENTDAGWKLENMQTFENNNGIYTWTGHLRRDEFRFPLQSDWWPCYQISGEGLENLSLVYGTSDEDKTNYRVPQAGTYTITINLTDPESPTVELLLVEADPEAPVTYTVAGTIAGDNWNNVGSAGLMTLEGEYYVAKNLDFKWRSTCYDDSPNDNWFELKICETGTWSAYGQGEGMNSANSAIAVSLGGDNIWVESPEGLYDVYFDKTNGKVWVMTAGYTPGQTPEPEGTKVVVYCAKFSEFDNSNLYTYDPEFAKWPGLAGELVEVEGAEYYKWEIDGVELGGSWNAVFTNADGTVQTVDITGLTFSEEQWFTVSTERSEGKYLASQVEGPGAAVVDVWGLAGGFNNWSQTATVCEEEDDWYVAKNIALDADGFKFLKNKAWDINLTATGTVTPNVEFSVVNGYGNGNTIVDPVGTYDIYLAKTLDKAYVMTPGYKPGETPDLPQENPDYQVSELYMLGGACDTGWDLSMMTKFAKVGEDWVWEGNLSTVDAFRFPLQKVSNTWWPCLVPDADGTKVVLQDNDPNSSYRVESDGFYKVTVTPLTGALSIERLGDRRAPSFITELYVIGTGAKVQGWNVPVTNPEAKFTNNNDGTFTWTGELIANEEFRFNPQSFDFGPSLSYVAEGKMEYTTGTPVNIKVAEAGIYTIVVDFNGGYDNITYTLTKHEEPEPEVPEPEVPAGPKVVTVAEFLAAEESADVWYELTGTITNISNTTYGNFDIQDETGSVYVYGLTATQVAKNDQSFSTLGLKKGDIVTLIGTRSSYNGSNQVGGPAYYVSHVEGAEPEIPVGSTVAEITFSEKGYANAEAVGETPISIDDNVSVVFSKGKSNTAPAYYTSGAAIRMYQNGATMDITAKGKTITSIELTFANSHYYVEADSGELSAESSVRTWTGSAESVKFTSTGTDKDHRAYVSAIKVIYE